MTDEELKHLFDAMRQDNDAMHAETHRRVGATVEAMRQENAAMHAETRRHFDVAAERMEKRFDLLAESVTHVNDELHRTRDEPR